MIQKLVLGAVVTVALSNTACAQQGNSQIPDVYVEADEIQTAPVTFSDVLAEYQALNTRLESVSAPLLAANAQLCPRTSRDIGITVHTITDYPAELRGVAQTLLGVDQDLSIRTVRAGSSAEAAGLRPRDEIVRIGFHRLKRRASSQLYFEAVSQSQFKPDLVTLDILRDGSPMTLEVAPETICGYPVITIFNETVNGHTDGKEVWITSELMRTVPDDVNLALIVAHELSHAIAGHLDERQSKALELEADRMALVLMARAGYDIDRAVAYWRGAPHPMWEKQKGSKSHPTIEARLANYEQSLRRIKALQKEGKPLTFGP